MNDKPRSRTARIAAIAAAVAFLGVSLGVTGPVSAQKKPVQNGKHFSWSQRIKKTSKAHKGGKKGHKGGKKRKNGSTM